MYNTEEKEALKTGLLLIGLITMTITYPIWGFFDWIVNKIWR